MREFKGFSHGVDLGGWYSQCNHTKERYDTFIKEEDFAVIAGWGLDHIRLPIDYELVEDAEGNFRPEGFERIRYALDQAVKNNLNVVLDLHKTYGYSFAQEYGESGFFDNEEYQERFYRLWEKLASEFAGYGEKISFELLNEVTSKEYCDSWNRISTECIRRIRTIAPDTYILLGGYYNNSIVALKDLAMPVDDRIVYNFHCYDPLIFTHQGAGWVNGMDVNFRIPVDATFGEMGEAARKMFGGTGPDVSTGEADEKLSSAYFDRCFAEAVVVAEERNVPLYCGEYGVIENATPEDTVKWYEMISESFNRFNIGRAAWSYRSMNFGLSDDRLSGVVDRLVKLL